MPYLLAPGPSANSLGTVGLSTAVPIGVGTLVGIEAIWLLVRIRLFPADPPRSPSRSTARILTVAGGVTLVVFTLLSVGWLGGWYLPSSGGTAIGVAGCGGYQGSGLPIEFPDGFPAGSPVHVRWASESGAEVRFSIQEFAPRADGSVPAWSYYATAVNGSVAFTGTGGEWAYGATNASDCPTLDSVLIRWSYALPL